eukprot:CAMPEP_0116135992 /NCGR_PEP_ID=MMETSP0329-20121206/11484_1 /TAXON_ID=697910 /ORGANISM="Pseudo-nitzschia arenysensis, Strain B593" /LENGTH=485 /DNA_ID=CAMNT_0003630825 /DNA_START=156 /DNA_END=1613 /DNA_ORIENTATION=+
MGYSDDQNDVSFASEQSGASSKKKGFKKRIKSAFGAGKRRRKKRSSASGSVDSQSYNDGDSAYSAQSADPKEHLLNPDGTANTKAQQEWINGGASGLAEMAAIHNTNSNRNRTNSAGGRGRSLGKIPELPNEDEDGMNPIENANSRRRRTKKKNRGGDASVSSKDSRRSMGSFFVRKTRVPADPLSLVVLLVEPTSLRFELLSLDFDLKPSRKSRSNSSGSNSGGGKRKSGQLQLTVQDVLDQITPEALTDETLKKTVASKTCTGLIDRSGALFSGTASLEDACAKRPLRPFDTALLKQQQSKTNQVLLSVPTYGGEPHRDVLLGFFGSSSTQVGDNDVNVASSSSTKEQLASALELARPIFADSNVVGLMETNGFNLNGWKPEAHPSKPKLEKPLPPPDRKIAKTGTSVGKLFLGLLAVVLATVLAWSLVAGGLHLLPSIANDAKNAVPTAQPSSLFAGIEGYLIKSFHLGDDMSAVYAAGSKK